MPTLTLTIAAVGDNNQQQSITDTLANSRGPTNTGIVDNGVVDGSGPTVLMPGEHSATNGCYSIGLLFKSVTIAQGTTLTSATLKMYAGLPYDASGTSGHFITMWISCQAADTVASLSTSAGDLRSSVRPRTTADTSWDITKNSDLSTPHQGDAKTGDCTAPVQEVINRAGWASGNNICVILDVKGAPNTGSGNTAPSEWNDFQAYTTGQASFAPQLIIVTGGAASTFPPVPAVWPNRLLPM
jgi:hypothetical protein